VSSPGDWLFFVVAGAVIAAAAGVAFARNILHAALSLLGTLLGVGAIFVFLHADFLAVTQLLLYVGGVLVLILFAVMLTHRIEDRGSSNPTRNWRAGAVLMATLWALFVFLAGLVPWGHAAAPLAPETTAEQLGDLLLGHWLLVFEGVSLLLLATLVGAVVVARREPLA
jgi:NAD(P)H-quinone oxidoreductase subunit 6